MLDRLHGAQPSVHAARRVEGVGDLLIARGRGAKTYEPRQPPARAGYRRDLPVGQDHLMATNKAGLAIFTLPPQVRCGGGRWDGREVCGFHLMNVADETLGVRGG